MFLMNFKEINQNEEKLYSLKKQINLLLLIKFKV